MKLSDLSSLSALSKNATVQSDVLNKKTGYDGKAVVLSIKLDTKARRGKNVTVISGFQSNPEDLQSLAQKLKKLCGSGGTVGDNVIELQGDHQEKVKGILITLGYSTK